MELMTEDDARARMRTMIDGKDWWVMPWLCEQAADLSVRIERDHYAGRASADFVIVYGSVGGVMIPTSFAKKSRMKPSALAKIMADLHEQKDVAWWADVLATQDVLIVCPDDNSEEAVSVRNWAIVWHEWVMGRLPA